MKDHLQKEMEEHRRLQNSVLDIKSESEEKTKQIQELSYQLLSKQETLSVMENQINYLDTFRTQIDDIKKENEEYKVQSDKKYQEQLKVLLEEKDAQILRLEDVIRNLETKQALTIQEHEREIFQMKEEHRSLVNHIKDELSFLQKTYSIEKTRVRT